MIDTNNIFKSKKGGEMNNIEYASEQFKQIIWPDFSKHFRSGSSSPSYLADIKEFMLLYETDFLLVNSEMVADYFQKLQSKVDKGELQPSTMAKKFRELHSLTLFILERKDDYGIASTFQNHFYPYLKKVAEVEKLARVIPMNHMDRILNVAQDDLMVYCIFVFLQRVGLSSTEVIDLQLGDFMLYKNGVYVSITRRKEPCFVPEDVYKIFLQYVAVREDLEYLFYNSRRKKLNTMYISRLLKKYTRAAGVPSYSAEMLRNSCAYTMFAYNVTPEQVARQMGISSMHVKRYQSGHYKDKLMRAANSLVKINVEPPSR